MSTMRIAGGSDLVAFMIGASKRTNNGSGPAFVLPSAGLKTPSAAHWSLGLEQELWQNLFFRWPMSALAVATCCVLPRPISVPTLSPWSWKSQ